MPKPKPATWDTVRRFALTLPGVEEGTAYGTPALRVRGKFMARLHEDRDSLVIKVGFDERDFRMQADPRTFYNTKHYHGYPTVLVRLSRVRSKDLRDVIEVAWRRIAPKGVVTEFERRANS